MYIMYMEQQVIKHVEHVWVYHIDMLFGKHTIYIYITQLETTRCISENNISFLKLPQIEYHMFKNKR